MSIKTVLTDLTDEQVRAVRDDRMALTDDLYKILDSSLDPLAIRVALFTHMTKAVIDAQDEIIGRVQQQILEFDERVAASAKETPQ